MEPDKGSTTVATRIVRTGVRGSHLAFGSWCRSPASPRLIKGRARHHLICIRSDPTAGVLRRHTGAAAHIGPTYQGWPRHHRLVRLSDHDRERDIIATNPDSMPVILRTEREIETWMTAPWEEARKLQRPLPAGALRIVAAGGKEDPPEPVSEPTLF